MKKLFLPFQLVSKEVYVGLCLMWCVIFASLWAFAPTLIPGLIDTFNALCAFLVDPDFYLDILASLCITIFGMLISIVVSCLVAYSTTMPFFRPLKMMAVLRFMSLAGFIFTFTLLLHDAYRVKLGLLTLGITPFFVLSLVTAIGEIDQQEYDFWTTLGYNRFEQLWQIVIRGKAEVVLKTIKANFAIAWIMITTIETYSMADGGIGVLLFKANGKTQIDKVFALQLCVLAFGALFDTGLKYLRLMLFPHVALAENK